MEISCMEGIPFETWKWTGNELLPLVPWWTGLILAAWFRLRSSRPPFSWWSAVCSGCCRSVSLCSGRKVAWRRRATPRSPAETSVRWTALKREKRELERWELSVAGINPQVYTNLLVCSLMAVRGMELYGVLLEVLLLMMRHHSYCIYIQAGRGGSKRHPPSVELLPNPVFFWGLVTIILKCITFPDNSPSHVWTHFVCVYVWLICI